MTFVGGAGNDVMTAVGGNNTFLFSGAFGFDAINGYQGSDKLVFMGVEGAGQGYDYKQHVAQSGADTVLKIGEYAVTLVGWEWLTCRTRRSSSPSSNVGASLLAKAVCQPSKWQLTLPLREQARSHRFDV